MSQTNPIRPSDLESLLADTFLQNVIHFSQTDSTNTRAIELLVSNETIETPCLLYAESQIAGRGRGANRWWSAEGGLTFSLIVDFPETSFPTENKPLLPLLTGMAILRSGEAFLPGSEFALKWPNDVYLAGRKLAGVLIEVPSQSSDCAVIGVGLNVNNSLADAPADIVSRGISMADYSGRQHDRIQVLRTFLREFESLFKSFEAGESSGPAFLNDWPDYCLLTGKQVALLTGSTLVTGVCHGIDERGALVLQTDTQRKSFFGGVVESWK